MIRLTYELDPEEMPEPIGLIVLQADETLEVEFKSEFAEVRNPMYVSRIPSAPIVSNETLKHMENDLASAAALLPDARRYAAVAYGCTSASSVIGSDRIEGLIKSACDTTHVTNPLKAACVCAKELGVHRFALSSPYVEDVNTPLRAAFSKAGISTDVFGSFEGRT